MHEILTIQLGHSANHIATHFWNAQVSKTVPWLYANVAPPQPLPRPDQALTDRSEESYFTYSTDSPSPVDHDILFRPGLTHAGEETYTPRTLIYDLKGGFGSLRRSGGLYDDSDAENANPENGVWYGTCNHMLPLLRRPLRPNSVNRLTAPPGRTGRADQYSNLPLRFLDIRISNLSTPVSLLRP